MNFILVVDEFFCDWGVMLVLIVCFVWCRRIIKIYGKLIMLINEGLLVFVIGFVFINFIK